VVKVIDYGVAKVLDPAAERAPEQTQTSFIGTPAFASPEQFASSGGTPIDTRSDIYSLGVTFWYLLTGRTPFVGRTLEEIRNRQLEALPVEQLRRLQVPRRCIALLRSMLALDPSDRPQSARQLLSEVYHLKFSAEARAHRRRAALSAAGTLLAVGAIASGIQICQQAGKAKKP
jgi:eukaryotic-like serine/threonine-protein kinase